MGPQSKKQPPKKHPPKNPRRLRSLEDKFDCVPRQPPRAASRQFLKVTRGAIDGGREVSVVRDARRETKAHLRDGGAGFVVNGAGSRFNMFAKSQKEASTKKTNFPKKVACISATRQTTGVSVCFFLVSFLPCLASLERSLLLLWRYKGLPVRFAAQKRWYRTKSLV